MEEASSQTPLQLKFETVIFGTRTKSGRLFDLILLITILCSVGVVMLDSISEVQRVYGALLFDLEVVFTALFTVEYLIRVWCVQRRRAYITSFWGILDLLALLPTYVAILVPEAAPLLVIRVIRVMRIFRVLRLLEMFSELTEIVSVLRNTSRSIFVFLVLVLNVVIVFACLLYAIEGPENGFTSIPMSIYWAIVTITTVGYGDIVPQTAAGRLVASMGMLVGYAIIAVPTAIITAKLWERLNRRRESILTWNCPVCALGEHASDAQYCKHCGASLDVPDEVRALCQPKHPHE